MSGLKPFRQIPRDLVEWERWCREQDFSDSDHTHNGDDTESALRWDDLRFPASAINPPGQVSDPDFDTTNGGWLFDSASTEVLFLINQLPHAWNVESELKPHVHWQKTTSASGTVWWQLDYKWSPIGEVMDAGFTTLSSTTVAAGTPDNDITDEHLITPLGTITAVGREISDMLVMKLSRLGGSDTYGADVRLLEFDIHAQFDGLGSREEFRKT